MTDRTSADLSEVDAALCALAEKLTREPAGVSEEDVARLRGLGLDDRGIFDAVHVVAYYNYVNRMAEGLGVELEPWWTDEPEGPDRFSSASVDLPEE